MAGDSGGTAAHGGYLRALASDYKTFAGLVGLLIYGVVRVAYDAFYSRLGVFPEAVGLSETTILGRAALYLAMTVAIAAIFVGLWLVAAGALVERPGKAGRNEARVGRWLFPLTLGLPVAAVGLVAAAGGLRGLLTSNHVADYCFARCKFAPAKPAELEGFHRSVQQFHDSHPEYRALDFGPEWLVVLPVILLVVAGVLGLLLRKRLSTTRTWFGQEISGAHLVFVVLAVAALLGGLLGPLLIDTAGESPGHGFLDTRPWLIKWGVFALVFSALVAGLLAVLPLLVGAQKPRRSPWLIAAFVVVLPLLLAFFEPAVPRFVEDQGAATVIAGAALWVALMLLPFRLWPQLRDHTVRVSAGLAILVALVAALMLDLAWERGIDLAQQASVGDQILARRFGLLSVRANAVCLEMSDDQRQALQLSPQPYMYLGETGGTLVLYDFISDIAKPVPTAFPVRAPASGIVVRDARRHEGDPIHGNWDCGPTS